MVAHPSDGPKNWPGIGRISVTGFKSLATKTDLEIRPLTILAGANSSGKSSLMQPLLLMKQTLESDVNPAGPFLLSGPYTRYTEARQFLSRNANPNGSLQFLTLEFGFNDGLTAGMTYSVKPETGLAVEETWGSNAVKKSKWKIAKTSTSEELTTKLLELSSVPLAMEHDGLTVQSVQSYQFYQCVSYSLPEGSEWTRRELYFMPENLELNSQIRRLIYVPGLRGDQLRKWLFAQITEHGFFEGPFESYVPSLIFSWQSSGHRSKIHQLVKALGALDLASGISSESLSESELEICVPRTRDSTPGDFVNVADVGLLFPPFSRF